MNTMIDLKNLLNWGQPKRVRTSQGERDLLKAQPNQQFSNLWKSSKEELKALGIGWSKEQDGSWVVVWWRPIDPAEAQAKAESLAASKATDAAVEIPVNAGLAYLGYQKAGIAYALGHEGTLIGDEMGLGKTIQAIGLVNADATIKSVLIVCPASVKLNWVRELRKWLTRPMSIQLVGPGVGWGDAQITVINYEMLTKHAAKVTSQQFDLAVIDESHRVKSPKAQRTKVFAQIKATRRVSMTGTPILNRPIELWTTLLWLDPVRWNQKGQSSYFQKRYCGAFMSQWGWDNSGATHLDELQQVLRTSVMVRRLKKDVLTELPPKVRQVVEMEADVNARQAAQAEMDKWNEFEELREEAKAAQKAAKEANDEEAYAAAVAALEEANAVAFESMSKVRHDTAVAKAPAVIEFVNEILEGSDEKLVLFAHHKDMIESFMAAFAQYGAVKLDGSMSDKAKQASIDRFQTDASCRVFVGSTLAAGVGITLTAASHVVFAELDWTPARVSQAEDRCHRIGQTDSVLVQHLVLEGSLDAYMAQMIVEKQAVADKALDKGAIEIKEQKTTIAVEAVQPELPGMSAQQVAAAHQAMKMLAGVCDGARSWDGAGFNKIDTVFGKSLAAQASLTQKQAAIAARLANKYRGQLPQEVLDVLRGSSVE